MKSYLHWSLRQLYLLFFWPTRLRSEAEDLLADGRNLSIKERVRYLQKILLWIAALDVLGSLVIMAPILHYQWAKDWWPRAELGILVGVISGASVGVAFDIVFGTAVSIVFGIVLGILMWTGVVPDMYSHHELSLHPIGVYSILMIVLSVVLGQVLSLSLNASLGRTMTVIFAVVFGVVFYKISQPTGSGYANFMSGAVLAYLGFYTSYFRIFPYVLYVVYSFFMYHIALARPKNTLQIWRLCPICWDEVIYFPLPYVSKLLIRLVLQDPVEGFKQIAFVSAERILQRNSAIHALTEMAIRELTIESLHDLIGKTARSDWSFTTISSIPELTAPLKRFNLAAHHIEQYFVLHSAYLQFEALSNALREVVAVELILLSSAKAFIPSLYLVAGNWRALLDKEQESLQALTDESREILNPFMFGNPVTETETNIFTGRGDIVRQVEENILGATQAPTLLLHGPRRMGKSSILKQLPRLLGPDFAPAVVDCQSPAMRESTAALIRYLSRSLSEGLRVRHVTIEPLSAAALAHEPFGVFDDWLDAMERAMPLTMRALLCLDEYERLQVTLDAGWGGDFLDTLRHTLQHRPRIVLMFIGAHTFAELGPAWTDRFISARRVRVSFLTREEVIPLLTEPIPKFDMTYAAGTSDAPGALDTLINATNGQPFLTQAVASDLVHHMNKQRRKEATLSDIETAITSALASGGEYFANVWFDAGEEGQGILTALAADGISPRKTPANKWLWEHDVLNDSGQFAVPMVERWVRGRVAEG